jgi:dipeptidyl aminopeptidase/acylaminoacyl peptidase
MTSLVVRVGVVLTALLLPQVSQCQASLRQAGLTVLFSQADEAKRQKDWPRVAEIATTILAKDPKAGRAWYRLGVAKENLHDDVGAEAAFQKAAASHYFEEDCLLEVASLAAKQGDKQVAFLYLQRLARKGFDQPGQIESTSELSSLKSDSRYGAILLRVRKNIRWHVYVQECSKYIKRFIFERLPSSFPPASSQVYAIDRDGSHEVQLTSGEGNHMMPDFSADGRQIVYSSGEDGKRKLHILDLQSQQDRVLIKESIGNEHYPSWSPDGQRIVFNNFGGAGRRQIFIVNTDGSGLKALTSPDYNSDYPRWTHSGSKITFESERAGMWGAYTMNPDGSSQDFVGWASTPNLSPDGKRFAFADSLPEGNTEMYVMNADGGETRRITNNRAEDWEPAWSPDGREIVFMSQRSGHFELYLMNPDGVGVRRLTKTPQIPKHQ